MNSGPNAVAALLSMVRARRVRRPEPRGTVSADHSDLVPILASVAERGISGIADHREALRSYITGQARVVPRGLSSGGALAFWINLYNAQILAIVDAADAAGRTSVLRVPGVFTAPRITVADETLSLDDIEHGKIRRFRDPRIHAALVCGSVSCPTLRSTPFTGPTIDIELDDQMRSFLRSGGASYESANRHMTLSRIFKWYGRDFTHPHRMPTLLPSSKRQVALAIAAWLDEPARSAVEEGSVSVEFGNYDWGIGCRVG